MTTDADAHAEFFHRKVVEWGAGHRRDFPWRNTTDPYQVLIAEMMLRRTRAEQVVPVYERFLQRFPHPRTLANTSEEDVREILRPLGLAWRVPAFRQLAQRLMEEYHGEVPQEREALLSLPGVGEYVADAVRCIAFNAAAALVDTNTVRVAGRYFGFPVNAESRRRVRVKMAVARLVDCSRSRESNLVLLDFAATVCRAERPRHEQCPVADACAWWQVELAKPKEEASYGDSG